MVALDFTALVSVKFTTSDVHARYLGSATAADGLMMEGAKASAPMFRT